MILKKTLMALAVATALGSTAAEAAVQIDGSSTVFPITEAVAEDFQRKTKTKVTVGISGTGGGFKKFCRGDIQISNASRPILKKEIDDCTAKGIQFVELPVAYDALTVVLNKNNTWVKQLTVDELKKVWENGSTVKSWKQVNSSYPDQPLKLYGPGADSGTFDYFTEAINGKAKSSRGDYTASEDDNVLVTGVSRDQGGLGYFGLAYYVENQDKLRAAPIVAKGGKEGVLPSEETVKNGTYQPLARPLFIYINAKFLQDKEVRAYIEYYLNNVTELAREVKYIPLPAAELSAVKAHWLSGKTGSGFGGVPEVGVKIEDLLKRIK